MGYFNPAAILIIMLVGYYYADFKNDAPGALAFGLIWLVVLAFINWLHPFSFQTEKRKKIHGTEIVLEKGFRIKQLLNMIIIAGFLAYWLRFTLPFKSTSEAAIGIGISFLLVLIFFLIAFLKSFNNWIEKRRKLQEVV